MYARTAQLAYVLDVEPAGRERHGLVPWCAGSSATAQSPEGKLPFQPQRRRLRGVDGCQTGETIANGELSTRLRSGTLWPGRAKSARRFRAREFLILASNPGFRVAQLLLRARTHVRRWRVSILADRLPSAASVSDKLSRLLTGDAAGLVDVEVAGFGHVDRRRSRFCSSRTFPGPGKDRGRSSVG